MHRKSCKCRHEGSLRQPAIILSDCLAKGRARPLQFHRPPQPFSFAPRRPSVLKIMGDLAQGDIAGAQSLPEMIQTEHAQWSPHACMRCNIDSRELRECKVHTLLRVTCGREQRKPLKFAGAALSAQSWEVYPGPTKLGWNISSLSLQRG